MHSEGRKHPVSGKQNLDGVSSISKLERSSRTPPSDMLDAEYSHLGGVCTSAFGRLLLFLAGSILVSAFSITNISALINARRRCALHVTYSFTLPVLESCGHSHAAHLNE